MGYRDSIFFFVINIFLLTKKKMTHTKFMVKRLFFSSLFFLVYSFIHIHTYIYLYVNIYIFKDYIWFNIKTIKRNHHQFKKIRIKAKKRRN